MWRMAVLLWGLKALAADEDPVQVLMRVRDQVVAHGERIPNYTCVETVQRERFQPAGGRVSGSCDTVLARRRHAGFSALLKLALTDRLRLDVALADGREIYSWAGAGKFEEGDIDELIPEGAIGTGPFAAMLLSVFEGRGPRFFFEGETTLAGRRLLEYSFTVPQERSTYRVKAHREWLITGFTGTLLVDPLTAELVRFTVRTDELPPATNACETISTLDYGLVRLRGAEYLLPKVARQRFIGREGSETENTLTFSACREYKAESTLTFGVKPAGERQPAAAPSGLPADLPVSVALAAPVQLDRAAAGDRLQGRLARPIRDERQQKTLAPEGALLEGRLMRVETRHSLPVEITVALRWETIEVDGASIPLSMIPDRQTGGLKIGGPGILRTRGVEIDLPLPGEGYYAIFHFKGEHAVMESGFRSEWLTARP
jgi:hypothetical protein